MGSRLALNICSLVVWLRWRMHAQIVQFCAPRAGCALPSSWQEPRYGLSMILA